MAHLFDRFEVVSRYRLNDDPGVCCAEIALTFPSEEFGPYFRNEVLLKVHYAHLRAASDKSIEEIVRSAISALLAQASNTVLKSASNAKRVEPSQV